MNGISGGRVVITGGLGFLGSNLAHKLAAENDVVVVDALTQHAGGNRANLEGADSAVTSIEADLALESTFSDRRVADALHDATHIFHCAARTSHPGSMEDPFANLESNGRATLLLLDRLRRLDSDARIVHPATTSQTGPMVRSPIDEHHPEHPRDIYSAHKALQEDYVRIYAHAHGLHAVNVRLSNVYGPRAAIHSPALGFANYFVGLGLQNATLPVYGEGRQRRSLLFVDDAVEALILAATDMADSGEVYQVADHRGVSIHELAVAITKHIGGRIELIPYPPARARTEIGDALFSAEKARRQLGWEPKTELGSGLATTAAYFRPCLDKYMVTA